VLTQATAWGPTLIASLLPEIAAQGLASAPSRTWIGLGKLAALATVGAFSMSVESLHPLSGYLMALTASALGDLVVAVIGATSSWSSRQGVASEEDRLFAQALLHLIPSALMALTVIGSLSREDLFLTGIRSPDAKLPLLPALPWAVVVPALALLLAAPLLPGAVAAIRSTSSLKTLNVLPRALAFAAVNAGQEELRFRAILLAQVVPALGPAQALALTSVFFGLAHWFGRPSGPTGAVVAAIAGWILGETMLGTGSFLPAWAMHGLLDALLFIAVALRARTEA
jgi:membrane protease YdiL (CAAX protease family)